MIWNEYEKPDKIYFDEICDNITILNENTRIDPSNFSVVYSIVSRYRSNDTALMRKNQTF